MDYAGESFTDVLFAAMTCLFPCYCFLMQSLIANTMVLIAYGVVL